MKRDRYLAKAHGNDIAALERALALFMRLAQPNAQNVIFVPVMKDFKDTDLAKYLISRGLAKFVSSRTLTLEGGIVITIEPSSNIKNFRQAKVIFGYLSTKYNLIEIEALPRWESFVTLSWIHEDYEEWEKAHQPTLI